MLTKCSHGKLSLFIAMVVVIAVFSSVSYISFLRWNLRENAKIEVERRGCVYLGRILGTADVAVMRCGEENISLMEVKE